MSEPRLCIAIPHLDRSEMLQRALDSCLAQTVPVRVVVADQGGSERTRLVMARYRDHPHVKHITTGDAADCLWANWRLAAEAAMAWPGVEFVSWLQDDDVITRIYCSRVIGAFDAFPQALHWQGNCHCTTDGVRAVKWGWNGPAVPVRMLDTVPELWPGGILLASMFVMSWALSPGVAFRVGDEFRLALEAMPRDCDLFNERLIVAALGAQGPWVADPVTAGLWVHHGANESYRQNADGSLEKQRARLIEGIDSLLDGFGEWRQHFFSWLRTRSPVEIVNWSNNWECKGSRYSDECLKIMAESIRDRVEVIQAPPGSEAPEPLVIYDSDAEAA